MVERRIDGERRGGWSGLLPGLRLAVVEEANHPTNGPNDPYATITARRAAFGPL